jgi:hypothetical protein
VNVNGEPDVARQPSASVGAKGLPSIFTVIALGIDLFCRNALERTGLQLSSSELPNQSPNKMKTTFLTLLAVVAFTGLVRADEQFPFNTAIIAPSDPPLSITVKENRFIRIVNFLQDVQTFGDDALQPLAAGKLQLTSGGRTVSVLTATFATQSEVQKDLFFSGPATITVAPIAGAHLILTYRTGKD